MLTTTHYTTMHHPVTAPHPSVNTNKGTQTQENTKQSTSHLFSSVLDTPARQRHGLLLKSHKTM